VELTCKREVAGSNSASRVACEYCAKNVATCDVVGGWLGSGVFPALKYFSATFKISFFFFFKELFIEYFLTHGKGFALCLKEGPRQISYLIFSEKHVFTGR